MFGGGDDRHRAERGTASPRFLIKPLRTTFILRHPDAPLTSGMCRYPKESSVDCVAAALTAAGLRPPVSAQRIVDRRGKGTTDECP